MIKFRTKDEIIKKWRDERLLGDDIIVFRSAENAVYNDPCYDSEFHAEKSKKIVAVIYDGDEEFETPTDEFSGCPNLRYISFPNNGTLRYIFDCGFQGTAIRELILPEGLIEIGDGCFSGCHSLEKVVLPKSCRRIGKYAFSNCPKLEKVVIPPKSKLFYGGKLCLGWQAFSDTPVAKQLGIETVEEEEELMYEIPVPKEFLYTEEEA